MGTITFQNKTSLRTFDKHFTVLYTSVKKSKDILMLIFIFRIGGLLTT